MSPLKEGHAPALLGLWSRRWGDQFPLDLALWRQNTVGDSRHFQPEHCWVIEEGKVVAGALVLKIPSVPPAWVGQDPRKAWISVLAVEPGREPEVAGPLLDHALGWLRQSEFERVAYGGDPSHFFPGVPESDAALADVLQAAGFQPGDVVHDLLCDLGDFQVPDHVAETLGAAEAAVHTCGIEDVPALLAFLDAHFPGRWAYETHRRLAVEPTPADVLLLRRNEAIIGFCHVYHHGSRRIGPAIYWRAALGDNGGGLGPIGVGAPFRGRGLGLALVALAVDHLLRLSVRRAVVDWTTLVDFYGRLGFRVWRTYRRWTLEL